MKKEAPEYLLLPKWQGAWKERQQNADPGKKKAVGKFKEVLGGTDYPRHSKGLQIKTHKAGEMIQIGGRHS